MDLNEEEASFNRLLAKAMSAEPPERLDRRIVSAARRQAAWTGIVSTFRRRALPAAAGIAVLLGFAAGYGGYSRNEKSLAREGEAFLEMASMAAVSDFYGDFEE